MEFDELQKIWDAQSNQPLYAINEKALHTRILSKLKRGRRITNTSELLLIIINLGAGTFILGVNPLKPGGNSFLYLMAAWMFATALYVSVSRIRRMRGDHRFDRSMYGDLHYAISMATYQVRLSQIMRWNILPIAGLTLLGLWKGGKSLGMMGLISICFVLAYYAGGWEHRIYKARRRELEILQGKLLTS